MGLSYPDVLVSTLAEVFAQFGRQLRGDAPPVKRKWYQRKPPTTSRDALANAIDVVVAQLLDLKRSPGEADVEWTATHADETVDGTDTNLTLGGQYQALSGSASRARRKLKKNSRSSEVAQRYRATKSEHLERAVTVYRAVMKDIGRVSPDSYIVLDDFCRLDAKIHPDIAGYFHRVVKDTGVWLKFGSISFWTRLYAGGPPAKGLQVPHDVRELSLDRGLLDFKTSKRFLEEILDKVADEAGVDTGKLFSAGAMDRLVLAAGGVPRDYIGLVSEAIAVAKNRGPSAKVGTDRVIAEDVNTAAGRTADTKFTDMDEDAGAEASRLRTLVIAITNHCRATGSASFMVNAANDQLVNDMKRLQNMRFVHSIASNETVPDQKSNRYNVYVLDVSQLAAQRAWQVDFMGWTSREKRRARKLIYPPLKVPAPSTEFTEPAQDDELAVVTDIDAG